MSFKTVNHKIGLHGALDLIGLFYLCEFGKNYEKVNSSGLNVCFMNILLHEPKHCFIPFMNQLTSFIYISRKN